MAMSRSLGGTVVTSRSPMRMRPLLTSSRPAEHTPRSWIPATGGADKNKEFAVANLQIYFVHRGLVVAGVDACDIVEEVTAAIVRNLHRQVRAERSVVRDVARCAT